MGAIYAENKRIDTFPIAMPRKIAVAATRIHSKTNDFKKRKKKKMKTKQNKAKNSRVFFSDHNAFE